jgi:myosin heavy subunit
MLIAMLGIGGYKTWEDHKRAIEAEKQREIQRIKNEEEMKRQQALLAELEKRRVERLEEERKWKEKQDELERQRRELEERTKQLEMQRQKNSKSQPVLEELKRLKEQKQQNEDQFQQLLKQQLQQQMGQNQGDNRQNQNAFNQGQQGQGQQSQQGQPGQKQGSQGQVWQSWQNSNQGTGQGYDDLLRQAANLSRSRNYNGAIQVNQQAIRANSARPDAYANIGWIALYGTGDMGLAMSHYKEAIQRGGMVYFRVMHDHQQMSFQDRCEGNLGIARDHLQYTSSNGIHNLKLSKAEIGEIRENKLPFRRVSGDFHIKAADGRNFNLLPVSNARLVRDMILQLASLK